MSCSRTQRSNVAEARTRDLRSRVKHSTTEPLCSLNFFLKNAFRNTTKVSNSLDPDQARRFVGPDLGPNCFQISSADDAAGIVADRKHSSTYWMRYRQVSRECAAGGKELMFFSSTLQYQRFYCLDAFELTICLTTDKFHFL